MPHPQNRGTRHLPIPTSDAHLEQALPEPVQPEPYWYTAEEIAQATAQGLATSRGEALRWLTEGVNLLPEALKHHDLERCLAQPTTQIDQQWDTLIAASIRYRLRTMGVEAPKWTYKQPLPELWFITGALPSRVVSAINLAPAELRRVGIMLPRTALDAHS